ncbi:MAG: hypothetical protein K8R19_13070 [Methanosarcinales archaeon]|jgi:hypothetical protein|nr:hypothetical protein [Methanosarcinales archaeon]
MEFVNKFNRNIRLTNERWKHITDTHPELQNLLNELGGALKEPEIVKNSVNNEDVVLFYRFYEHIYKGKYMCVVVKLNDESIITAYITDRIKRGEVVWKKN